MSADLITIATTAVLTQFLTPAAKNFGEVALERAKQVGAKATSFLITVGRTPQPVEEKLLLPLLQAASLETNETLADLWAALLANAADPDQQAIVQPVFISILRELTPTDALVLHRIYRDVQPSEQELLYYEMKTIITERFASELALSVKQFALSVETLRSLRLCTSPTPRNDRFDKILPAPVAASRQVCPTVLGLDFLAACCPPTP